MELETEHLHFRRMLWKNSVSEVLAIVPGDFNNDGRFEIVVAYDSNDIIDILALYNTSCFPKQTTYSTGS